MAENKGLTLIQQQGKEEKIRYDFYRTLPIEIEAINEIQNDEIKLNEFKKLNKKYNDLLTEWYELFGIVNDPDISKVFRVTELHKNRGTEYFNNERKKLHGEIYPIGRVIEKLEFKNSILNNQNPEIFLDYSDNSQSERIVFLHELGILEFLQSKMNKELHGFSANKLAEIISTFTNVEQKTAQSYLNPIFTKDTIQKNNPLTKSNLEKVKNKLKNIGFNTSKSA